MRKVIFLRHAKSSWPAPGVDDFDRPLNERGVSNAKLIAKWMTDNAIVPDHILCSSALRTSQTLEIVCQTADFAASITKDDEIYLASSTVIARKLSQLVDDVETALLIGHNPGIHDTVLDLLTPAERSSSGSLRATFQTAACAVLDLPIDHWSALSWDIGVLTAYMFPKALSSLEAS